MQRCLEEARSSFEAVDAFAVASGPGSFTGLRIGLTTVKGFAETLGRPIAAVSRLLALATIASASREWVASVVDASRGEVFGALYERREGLLVRRGDECVCSAGEFLASVGEAALQSGVLWATLDPEVITQALGWASRSRMGDEIEVVSSVLAPAIGRIGYQKFLHGELVDALHLDANYIRRSDAERFWKTARPGPHGS